jgi:hypothetical protein
MWVSPQGVLIATSQVEYVYVCVYIYIYVEAVYVASYIFLVHDH